MRRVISALLVVLIMTIGQSGDILLADSKQIKFADSELSLVFANGPSENQDVKGLFTLSLTSTGNGTISSIELEISSDGSSWTSVANLTTTPWLKHVDTTEYANGTWTFRARAWDSLAQNFTTWFTSGQFNIVNQVPVITSFDLTNSGFGSGTTAIDRAWYALDANGTLAFTWSANDDDLTHASLANVPGPGSPSDDGPGTIAYGWDWNTGSIAEGTYNPRLTVWDNSGLSVSKTMFIGIDRTAPVMSSPTIGNGGEWSDSTEVIISDLDTAADDGSGSGVDYVQIQKDGVWSDVSGDSTTISFSEGEHQIKLRAVDIVGNIGDSIEIDVKVDVSEPEGIGWTVDELTTSLVGSVNISFSAQDLGSGIDLANSKIQYGFDLNGVGATPDQSGRWIDIGVTGLDGTMGLASWATKSRQYLMLRAVVTDNAGNELVTIPNAFQILPGLDLSWNASQTNVDRLVVRPGDTNGDIVITSMLEANQGHGGAVTVYLQAAPADRTANVEWTTMQTVVVEGGNLSDECRCELIVWDYVVPNTGQWDLRLVIDPSNVIDERDESNNNHHMMVTGASVSGVGVVTSFAPGVIALIVAGIAIAWYQRRKVTLPPN
ncbi:MAG: hypothetical protein DWC06_00160 [Candidatus Poseidoniales archaeon]|nr:MAG: hypothetical protein DWC06_00160 [Candidatus Poseidoniales archaeon]